MAEIKKKRVNIYPKRGPITNVNPPIRVPVKNQLISINDIRKCIVAGAKVDEVLPDKSVVSLNLQNYNIDNGGAIITIEDTNRPNPVPHTAKRPASNPYGNKMTNTDIDDIKKKFNNNKSLIEELTRTADEADAINEAKKKAAEEEKPVVAETAVEEEKKTYVSKRQLRKLREQQEKKAAEDAATKANNTLADELETMDVDEVIKTVDPEKM